MKAREGERESERDRVTQQLIMQVRERWREKYAENESGFTATSGKVNKINTNKVSLIYCTSSTTQLKKTGSVTASKVNIK